MTIIICDQPLPKNCKLTVGCFWHGQALLQNVRISLASITKFTEVFRLVYIITVEIMMNHVQVIYVAEELFSVTITIEVTAVV